MENKIIMKQQVFSYNKQESKPEISLNFEQTNLPPIEPEIIILSKSSIPTIYDVDKFRYDEKKYLKFIHKLYSENFREYLIEAQTFRKIYRKNVKCDVCGEWENDLCTYRDQTYCEKHIPVERPVEHKITPGRHGSAINFIKK
jgi:hypothetical protein